MFWARDEKICVGGMIKWIEYIAESARGWEGSRRRMMTEEDNRGGRERRLTEKNNRGGEGEYKTVIDLALSPTQKG